MASAPASIFDQRETYSRERLRTLESRIADAAERARLTGLSIFTVGSYGRLEASEHSDIDLFFIYEKEAAPGSRRTSELKLFGRLIESVEEMDFPALSNDAQYLESHLIEDVLSSLGGPTDDARNHFTMRMLLLLESRSVFGRDSYETVIAQIVDSYYRDYPNHEGSFRPWFLLNDIMRFWKTLLLNYEHKRNRPSDNPDDPRPRVKNFKLKYSRATTCFATICALGSMPGSVTAEDVKSLVTVTPQARLAKVAENYPGASADVQRVLDDYSWFLEQTALDTVALESKFATSDGRRAMFERATSYSDSLFNLVKVIDSGTEGRLLRALVL